MKKRTISILLSLLLVIGLIPLSAFTVLAAEGESVYNDQQRWPVLFRQGWQAGGIQRGITG